MPSRSRSDEGTLIGEDASPATSDGLDPDPREETEPAPGEEREPVPGDGTEPAPEEAEADAVAPPTSSHRRGLVLWIGLGMAAAALVAGAVLLAALHHRGGPLPARAARSPTPSPVVPARTPFQFSLNSVTTTSFTGRNAPRAARNAAEQIRVALSGWYDAAFADPAEWKSGPAPTAWAIFSPTVLGRAKRDKETLSLGPVEGLIVLEPTRSKLRVRVLLDPALKTVGAVAYVTFDAAGRLADGDLLEVTNTARFVFRPVGGHWVVVAYPSARTTANESPAPSPSPLAGPTASATG